MSKGQNVMQKESTLQIRHFQEFGRKSSPVR